MKKGLLKKGDRVVMHTCLEAEKYNGKIWTCATDEIIKGEGCYKQGLVFLENFSSSFDTSFLQKINIEVKPINEWGEDYGDCLWWSFPIEEPPYCGTPLDLNFPNHVTHFTMLILPNDISSQK